MILTKENQKNVVITGSSRTKENIYNACLDLTISNSFNNIGYVYPFVTDVLNKN